MNPEAPNWVEVEPDNIIKRPPGSYISMETVAQIVGIVKDAMPQATMVVVRIPKEGREL